MEIFVSPYITRTLHMFNHITLSFIINASIVLSTSKEKLIHINPPTNWLLITYFIGPSTSIPGGFYVGTYI